MNIAELKQVLRRKRPERRPALAMLLAEERGLSRDQVRTVLIEIAAENIVDRDRWREIGAKRGTAWPQK